MAKDAKEDSSGPFPGGVLKTIFALIKQEAKDSLAGAINCWVGVVLTIFALPLLARPWWNLLLERTRIDFKYFSYHGQPNSGWDYLWFALVLGAWLAFWIYCLRAHIETKELEEKLKDGQHD